MTEPIPLLKFPPVEVPVWMPTTNRMLAEPRFFRIGPWTVYEDCDRTINVADQKALDWMATWPGVHLKVLTGDPLPPPFDFDEEEDGRVIPLTYDRLLASIERTNKAMERLGR